MMHEQSSFDISLAHRHDHLVAVYIRLSANPVATTREIVASTLLADFDAAGNLVGLELLGPIHIHQLRQAVTDPATIDTLWHSLRTRAPEFAAAA